MIPPGLFLDTETYTFKEDNNLHTVNAVKPVCSDHLYNKIYYLWFIQ